MKYLKTPLRYPGGKSRVAKDFIPRFPTDIGQFREPFLGGGSVALEITKRYPHIEIWVNDLYEPLYNFWCELQHSGSDIQNELKNLKYMKPWAAFNLIGRPKATRSSTLETNLLKFARENMLKIDAEEGIGAFIEKRKPNWQDK